MSKTETAETDWVASAETLRTASLALVYSTAEYCAPPPVWLNSLHTNKIDIQLNNTMWVNFWDCKINAITIAASAGEHRLIKTAT
jgi:hypothetical protein